MELWPILIPSKNRPKPPTVALLQEHGLSYTLFLEPQDWAKYPDDVKGPCAQKLSENDRGIAWVRNKALEFARAKKWAWYWTLDDDISFFGEAKNRKIHRKHPKEVLLKAQKLFQSTALCAQGGLEYQQLAWTQRKEHTIGYCEVATAINTERTKGIRYREEMNLKEDRDFTLQILSCGYLTVRACMLCFGAPTNGSNKGGLHDEYKAGKEKAAVDRMVKAWPGICKPVVKTNGRYDLKINWRAFHPN